jgi:multiple sugar transport system ATP-binding protein
VAGFIGSPPMNLFKGVLRRSGPGIIFVEEGSRQTPLTLPIVGRLAELAAAYVEKPVVLGIRPEDVHRVMPDNHFAPGICAEARVEIAEPMGAETHLYLHTGATGFVARVKSGDRFEANQAIKVAFDMARVHLFDAKTEAVLGDGSGR